MTPPSHIATTAFASVCGNKNAAASQRQYFCGRKISLRSAAQLNNTPLDVDEISLPRGST
jgi:hypothetical protein